MAEDAIDAAVKMGKFDVPACSTANMQLLGADRVGVICGHKFDRVAGTITCTSATTLSYFPW